MKWLMAVVLLGVLACPAQGPTPAAPLDTRHDTCAFCRMAVSDARFAAQVAAPGEEPRFFDDVGCLVGYVAKGGLPAKAVLYVADHRTRAWVAADHAVFTRNPGLTTPMASHLIAHADAASQQADPDARGGTTLPWATLLQTPIYPGASP